MVAFVLMVSFFSDDDESGSDDDKKMGKGPFYHSRKFACMYMSVPKYVIDVMCSCLQTRTMMTMTTANPQKSSRKRSEILCKSEDV